MAQKQNFFHLPRQLHTDVTSRLYAYLRDNVKWDEGIRSRKGPTRKAAAFTSGEFRRLLDDYPEVLGRLNEIVDKYSIRKHCDGVYINYYRDGDDWTPNHTHPGTTQLVLSLGATRQFVYSKSTFDVKDGDIAVFGATTHGVPKQLGVTEGRISIAMFMTDDADSTADDPDIIYFSAEDLLKLMSIANGSKPKPTSLSPPSPVAYLPAPIRAPETYIPPVAVPKITIKIAKKTTP